MISRLSMDSSVSCDKSLTTKYDAWPVCGLHFLCNFQLYKRLFYSKSC